MINDDYNGEIKLSFINRNNRTLAKDTYHRGNSRISSEIPTTGSIPYYFLISTGGGFTEGESYLQEVSLSDHTHAILTTQTPNYIYKCDNGLMTTQNNQVVVGEDCVLEYYLDETIPYENANYRQYTDINMKSNSKLILTDGLTSGWSYNDEPFKYRNVGIKTRIFVNGKLKYNDYLLVEPANDPMDKIGYFEGSNNFNSVVIIDKDIDDQTVKQMREFLQKVETTSRYGISLLEDHGLVLRILGESAHNNRKLMWQFINFYREQILYYTHIDLRKSEHLED